MKQAAMSLALALALCGCAAVSDLPQGYRLGGQEGEGLAVVSLTLSGEDLERVSSFTYRVRQATGDAIEEVARRPYFDSALQQARWLLDVDAHGPPIQKLIVKDGSSNEPLDVLDGGRPVGRVAVLRLPPGEYTLSDWRLLVPNRYGGDELRAKRTAAYRFAVEAGHATYLGNLNLHLTDQDTYRVTVEDNAKRDLALLAKKLPSLRAEDIRHRPPVILPQSEATR